MGEMSPVALEGHTLAQETKFATYLRELIRDAQGVPKHIVVRTTRLRLRELTWLRKARRSRAAKKAFIVAVW